MGGSIFKHDGILWGNFSRIYVGSQWSDTGIIEGSKFNHISILKGSQEHVDSSQ